MTKQGRSTCHFPKVCSWAVKDFRHVVALTALLGTGSVLAQPIKSYSPAMQPAAVTFFGLAHTAQTFSLMGNGGVLDVLSTDSDPGQVAAIQSRLRERGLAFTEGDIPTPTLLPPDALPGLAELRAGTARVAIAFEELPAGGRLSFTTQDPALLPILSNWLMLTTQESGATLRIGVPPDARTLRENTR